MKLTFDLAITLRLYLIDTLMKAQKESCTDYLRQQEKIRGNKYPTIGDRLSNYGAPIN